MVSGVSCAGRWRRAATASIQHSLQHSATGGGRGVLTKLMGVCVRETG
jgi:hypothetical protein